MGQPLPLHERLTLGLLTGILLVSLGSWLLGHATAHPAMIIGCATGVYAGFCWLKHRMLSDRNGQLVLSAFMTIGILFFLYVVLGRISFEVMPYIADPLLAWLDVRIGLGTVPALWAERFVTDASTRLFSVVYALFIPYLYLSIFLGLLGRPASERDAFVTGFTVLYALSFLGYLLLPARGPIVFYQHQFAAPLPTNVFHAMIVHAVDQCGGPHGAFPSLHVGASAYACLFDLQFNRVRGMLYLPLVLLIAMATILLRYHYVVDLWAGAALAALAFAVARSRITETIDA